MELLSDAAPLLTLLLALASGGYAATMIWFARGLRHQPARVGGNAVPSAVTVVVAARDEERVIGSCLDDLLAQDYPHDLLEVIVVDDGSRDGTAAQVRKRGEGDSRVRLLVAGGAGAGAGLRAKKRALTTGVEAAAGEIILTTDADCRLPAGWVRSMVEQFADDVGLVAGFSAIDPVPHLRGGLEGMDFLILMGCAAGSIGNGHPMGGSSQNLAYRKAAFAAVGGYDRVKNRASGDDVLLIQLIRRQTSWKAAFAAAPESFVRHPPSSSWRSLLGQRQRWASNAPFQRYLDPVFFCYLLVTFTLAAMLLAAPALLWAGLLSPAAVLGSLLIKVAAELTLLRRTTGRFGRRDLLTYYPLWTLLQPLYTTAIGLLGTFGRVAWKGVVHERGGALEHGGDSGIQQQPVADAPGGDGQSGTAEAEQRAV